MDRDNSAPKEENLEDQVARAQNGDRAALETVVCSVEANVYSLALRFLWHPQDAEDATQEILIRIITRLSSYRRESAFRTWVYRVACNRLLSFRKRVKQQQDLNFDEFGNDLARDLSDEPRQPRGVEKELLLEEVKIGCTHAMLLCLDRDHRFAFILGEILELDHREASEVLDIAPATFRKRLSRARRELTDFMKRHCGLFDPENACRCHRRTETAVKQGRVDPNNLLFAANLSQAQRFPEVLKETRRLEEARRAAALYRSHTEPKMRQGFAPRVRRMLALES